VAGGGGRLNRQCLRAHILVDSGWYGRTLVVLANGCNQFGKGGSLLLSEKPEKPESMKSQKCMDQVEDSGVTKE